MAKKKSARVMDFVPEEIDPFDEPEYVEQVEEPVKTESSKQPEDTSKPVLWEEVTWAGVKKVFRCVKCGEFRDTKDDMIMHVVSHFPEEKQNQIFDQLVVLARPRGELAGLT
ncbi:MAG: hypothetical protein CVU43_04485 [Chloroflexi bacterium HGW-Chloroflexi-5]|nr:MAG: hypothetical protein CVU43_04485 [Chloroflexi bacterium HGW-Chloroflexi-5]